MADQRDNLVLIRLREMREESAKQFAALRDYLDLQFAMIRNRDNAVEGLTVEVKTIEELLRRHEKRIAALEIEAN
jgi:hypothetical protein